MPPPFLERLLHRQLLLGWVAVLLAAHVAVVLVRGLVHLQVPVGRERGAAVAQRLHLLRRHRPMKDGVHRLAVSVHDRNAHRRGGDADRLEAVAQPVAGAEVNVNYGVFRQHDTAITNGEGHYEAHVLPGAVSAGCWPTKGPHKQYGQEGTVSDKKTNVPVGSDDFELPSIVLTRFQTIKGTVIDARGKPVAGAEVTAIRDGHPCVVRTADAQGTFEFQVAQKLAPTSYEVSLPNELPPPYIAKVVERDPLVLSIDTPSTADRSPPKPDASSKKSGDDSAWLMPKFEDGLGISESALK